MPQIPPPKKNGDEVKPNLCRCHFKVADRISKRLLPNMDRQTVFAIGSAHNFVALSSQLEACIDSRKTF